MGTRMEPYANLFMADLEIRMLENLDKKLNVGGDI